MLRALTLVHVAISLVAIAAGFVVIYGFLTSKRLDGWTALFLVMTVATSVTGFLFPFHGFIPAVIIGIVSMVLLAIAIYARYSRRLTGPWRWIFVSTAMLSQYLNFFILIAQLFMKVPALNALAPTQSEPPFLVTQLAALLVFLLLTIGAIIKFRPTVAQ